MLHLAGKNQKSEATLAKEMLQNILEWFSDRKLVFLGDGAYSTKNLLGDLDPRVTYVGVMRADAAICDPTPPKQSKSKRGRKATKGPRLPNPKEAMKKADRNRSGQGPWAWQTVNARHPEEVYRFFTEALGCYRLQWLPCVAPVDFHRTAPGYWDIERMPIVGTAAAKPGSPESVVTEWSVDPDDWGDFLCQTFYLWLKHGLGKVLVNWFESLVGQWMGQPPQMCNLAPICGRSLVTMDQDGNVYSCDHFVFPEYKLGNLREPGCQLVDLAYSPQQQRFGYGKRDTLPDYCKRCKYVSLCNGECPKNRFIKTPDGQPGLNYLCPGIRRFMTYAEPYFNQIIAQLHGSGSVTVNPVR